MSDIYLNIASELKILRNMKVTVIPGGVRGVMVIVVGNGHEDTSSNSVRD